MIHRLKADRTTSTESSQSRPAVGAQLAGQLAVGPGWTPQTVTPVVQRCDEREFVWRGQVVHDYAVCVVHRFAWGPAQDDESATDWVHSEEFLGMFGWAFLAVLGTTLRGTFESMNEKLKALAETKYAATLMH